MPIVGNLSEFPLPEVLLLIGRRTGRLRLLDIPEFGVLDIDISSGEIQAMRAGPDAFIESPVILDKLGAIMQTQGGMFEFRLSPVYLVERPQTLTIHELAMKLVCHVDEQVSRQQMVPADDQIYRLAVPQPEIWIEPELDLFFNAIRSLLANGATLDGLARALQMDNGLVHKNLTDLRLLGLVELISKGTSAPVQEEPEPQEELQPPGNVFRNPEHISERIRKYSSGSSGA